MDELIEKMARAYAPHAWEEQADLQSTLRLRAKFREHALSRSVDVLRAIEASGKYRVVPVEPTEEVLRAAFAVTGSDGEQSPETFWSAILAASPKVPA